MDLLAALCGWCVAFAIGTFSALWLWYRLTIERPPKQFPGHKWRRRLGEDECLFHQLYLSYAGLMVRSYNLGSDANIDRQAMLTALTFIQRKHPMLRMSIQLGAGAEYWFVDGGEDVSSIDVAVIHANNITSLEPQQSLYEELLHTKFDGDRLWRVRLLVLDSPSKKGKKDYVFYFSCHHAICDGISLSHFLHEMFRVLSDTLGGQPVLEPTESLPVLASVDDLLDFRMSWWDQLLFLRKVFRPLYRPKENPYLRRHAPVYISQPDVECRTKTVYFEVDRAVTSALRKRCRQNDTTMHGVLTAAIDFSLYEETQCGGEMDVFSGHSISLRKYCRPEISNENVGCYITVLPLVTKIRDGLLFWEHAKQCSRTIHESLARREHLELAVMLPKLSKWIVPSEKASNSPGQSARSALYYILNNVGDCDPYCGETGDNITVTGLQRAFAGQKMGYLLAHNVHTLRGKLQWTMAYYTQYMTKQQADRFSGKIREHLIHGSL